jgi:hypothetical protein
MSILKKVLTYFVFPLIIAGMVYAVVQSVMEPVEFNKYRAYRESIAIQRLKDVRDLQVAFKNVNGRYASTVDSLKLFYNEGKMKVVMQIGSRDDSLAMANTQALKKRNPKIKPEQMLELHNQGQKLVFQIENEVAVRDTLFTHRTDFCVDSLAFIPFCGDSLIMESTIKTVSGVKVPLFEACIPYAEKITLNEKEGTYYYREHLLKGMNHQLIVNHCEERLDTERYPGLKVGSISAPNNNAGNWE